MGSGSDHDVARPIALIDGAIGIELHKHLVAPSRHLAAISRSVTFALAAWIDKLAKEAVPIRRARLFRVLVEAALELRDAHFDPALGALDGTHKPHPVAPPLFPPIPRTPFLPSVL